MNIISKLKEVAEEAIKNNSNIGERYTNDRTPVSFLTGDREKRWEDTDLNWLEQNLNRTIPITEEHVKTGWTNTDTGEFVPPEYWRHVADLERKALARVQREKINKKLANFLNKRRNEYVNSLYDRPRDEVDDILQE